MPLRITSNKDNLKPGYFKNSATWPGGTYVRTIAYHLPANDMGEHLHCQFKAAIHCYNSSWSEACAARHLKRNTSALRQPRSCTVAPPRRFLLPTIQKWVSLYTSRNQSNTMRNEWKSTFSRTWWQRAMSSAVTSFRGNNLNRRTRPYMR